MASGRFSSARRIAKQRPDLILMGVQLPIMDGYTATSQIKADPALPISWS